MVRCQEHELLTQDQVQVDELTVNQVHKVVQNSENIRVWKYKLVPQTVKTMMVHTKIHM
jgi:hypothetical protein